MADLKAARTEMGSELYPSLMTRIPSGEDHNSRRVGTGTYPSNREAISSTLTPSKYAAAAAKCRSVMISGERVLTLISRDFCDGADSLSTWPSSLSETVASASGDSDGA